MDGFETNECDNVGFVEGEMQLSRPILSSMMVQMNV
jgi:hypothetical protein